MIKNLIVLFGVALAACGGSSTVMPIGQVDDDKTVQGKPVDKTKPVKQDVKHESK